MDPQHAYTRTQKLGDKITYSYLDYFITSPNTTTKKKVLNHIGNSDHKAIELTIHEAKINYTKCIRHTIYNNTQVKQFKQQ